MDAGSSEVFKNIVTACGIVVGGVWAFWRWSLSEYLRRRREIPSFDGDISVQSVALNEDREVLTVNCRWRNVGAVPLSVNTQETRISVYEIAPRMELGAISPRLNNVRSVFDRKPWGHWDYVTLEPGTSSNIQAHFMLEANRAYIFACRLEAVTKPKKSKQVWVREVAWCSSGILARSSIEDQQSGTSDASE